MLVKDLIQDTLWLPGSSYGNDSPPSISVLLPTFRRGKSGLFKRAVESILSQTLYDLELIIIDDASTDGTFDQILDFQQKDGRVSCLHHQKNIGLPAISEYEGYLHARANRISFAFDDTLFNPNALEELLAESKKAPWAVIYGHIEWSYKANTGEIVTARLGAPHSQGLLRTGNFIPNNGVLMPKNIIEDVGFYDPHIVMARVCDWDLWCRVAERYELKFVDVAVGLEDGPMTTDSLGNTYELDSWAVNEWMRTPRNEKLRPINLSDYEVLAPNPLHGLSTQTVCESLAKKHAVARSWSISPIVGLGESLKGYILVVNLHYDASTSLCFDMLPQDIAKCVRVISYNSGFCEEELARATCIIFVRSLRAYQPWIRAAKALNIPIYYFLDDNLPLLAKNGEVAISGEDYRPHKLRDDLMKFDGVLLSSRKLVSYFEDNLLHVNLNYFPVAFSGSAPLHVDYFEKKSKQEIVIASTGGAHRADGLWDIIVPALEKISLEGFSIHLVIPQPSLEQHIEQLGDLSDNIRITTLPFDPGYLFAMRRFARFSPDFIVHAPSDTENNSYKTLNVLLSANLIGAIPVLPFTPPYDEIKDIGNAIIVEEPFKPISWYRALKKLLEKSGNLSEIKNKNSDFCNEHFSGKENLAALSAMISRHGGEVTWSEQSRRLHRLASWSRSTTGLPAIGARAEQANEQAMQLAAFRKMTRYSWRHRFFPGNSDLWNLTAQEFAQLKLFSEKMGWRKRNSSLELSDPLHELPYREYQIKPPAGNLSGLSLAISVDWIRSGIIGIELVGPDELIKNTSSADISMLDLSQPIRFDFPKLVVKSDEIWSLRVFARSITPVYVFEFINRSVLGLKFYEPTPFMELFVD